MLVTLYIIKMVILKLKCASFGSIYRKYTEIKDFIVDEGKFFFVALCLICKTFTMKI